MRTVEQIVQAYTERKNRLASVHATGELLQRVYDGDHHSILPELNRQARASIANLIQTGVDQHAMRIASVMPVILSPAVRDGRAARRRADDRRRTLGVWSYHNKLSLKTRRRARHLTGLATSPVFIRPGSDGIPVWELQEPLQTFPAPCDPDELVPPDCIVSLRRSYRWLADRYDLVGLSRTRDNTDDTLFTVLRYVAADEHVLVCMGQEDNGEVHHVELARTENRAGVPLVVIPGRITLGKLQGQFDQMIGMYEAESELWALQLEAVKRGIFGETWIYGNDPDIEQVADPVEGIVGKVTGGQIEQFRVDASQQPLQAIDRLERAQRLTGAVPAEFGGESPSNVRTARRGQQVQSSTVDFPVQEHQELLAASMEREFDIAIAIAKAYWGDTQRTFQIPYARGPVTYTPNVTFETDSCVYVAYSYAGSDTNGLVIEAGQRIGMGTLSKQSFMEIDPLVNDPDSEGDRIVLEGIQAAALSAIQTQAADPNGPWQPKDLARLEQLIYENNMPLYEAVQKLHEELQAEQQAAASQQLPASQMQPGLGQAGAPGTPQAAIGGPNSSQSNLVQLLGSLRLPQRQSPAELASPG